MTKAPAGTGAFAEIRDHEQRIPSDAGIIDASRADVHCFVVAMTGKRPMNSDIPAAMWLALRGRIIRVDGFDRICISDFYNAEEFGAHRSPSDWGRLDSTRRLMKALLERLPVLNRETSKKFMISDIWHGKTGTNGGVFVHPVLAVAYAGYLSPKLEIEVRETWLRSHAGDPTLADEILSRASPEANLWAARRAHARAVRNEYTAALKEHEVTGRGYSDCTDEAYRRLFDHPAWRLRERRGLPKKANVRDSMNLAELATIALTEVLASERIKEEDPRGNRECQDATGRTATNIRRAIDAERADRHKRLLP